MRRSESRERGATLTLFAIATALVLGALGSAHFVAAQNTFRLAMMRERAARARAAAEGAVLAGAVRAAGGSGPGTRGEERLGAMLADWRIDALEGGRASVRASVAAGDDRDRVVVRLVAEVELGGGPGRAPRILRIAPED